MLLRIAMVGLWTSAAAVAWTAEPAKTVSLESRRAKGSVDRVDVTLDVSGHLSLSAEWKVERLKMSAAGSVRYEERSLEVPADSTGVLRSIRYYEKADALIHVGADESKPRLRDQRRLIGVEIDAKNTPKIVMFSPQGTLTSDELELVDLIANSLLADRLLPDKPVAVGATWRHSDLVIASLCDLDRVGENTVQSTLSSVEDDMARMEMAGTVKGTQRGLSTTIELKAKYRFDLKLGRITWLGMALRQNRERGRVDPGLEVVARLQMIVEPISRSERLSDEAIAGLSLAPTEELRQIAYESQDGTWRLSHDRIWEITTQKNDAATLRMAAEGDALAQCKISALAQATKPEQQVSLADFQADIQRALDKSFGQFVEASQTANQADYRVFRVVIRGKVKDVPIRWIYCLLADKLGHRAVFVFDLKEEHVDRFAHADERLVNSFRFLGGKAASRKD